jgi:hypothetical protein
VDTIRGDYTRYHQRTLGRRPSRHLPGNHAHRHHQSQSSASPPSPPSCCNMLIPSKTRRGTLDTRPLASRTCRWTAPSVWRRVSRYACDGGQHSQRPRGGVREEEDGGWRQTGGSGRSQRTGGRRSASHRSCYCEPRVRKQMLFSSLSRDAVQDPQMNRYALQLSDQKCG